MSHHDVTIECGGTDSLGTASGPLCRVVVSCDDLAAAQVLMQAAVDSMEAGNDAATASQSDVTGTATCTFDGTPAPARFCEAVKDYIDDPPVAQS